MGTRRFHNVQSTINDLKSHSFVLFVFFAVRVLTFLGRLLHLDGTDLVFRDLGNWIVGRIGENVGTGLGEMERQEHHPAGMSVEGAPCAPEIAYKLLMHGAHSAPYSWYIEFVRVLTGLYARPV